MAPIHPFCLEVYRELSGHISIPPHDIQPLTQIIWRPFRSLGWSWLFCDRGLQNHQASLNDQFSTPSVHPRFKYIYIYAFPPQHHSDVRIRNCKSLGEFSALDLASQYGRIDTVHLLVRKAPPLLKEKHENHSPLHLAAKHGHKQVVDILINAGYGVNTLVSLFFCILKVWIYM